MMILRHNGEKFDKVIRVASLSVQSLTLLGVIEMELYVGIGSRRHG